MAIALTVARIMAKYRHRLKGRIKFVFQPGEEGAGGALAMIKEGILDDDPVPDVVLGMHLWQPLQLGTVGMAKGAIMSGSSTFQITVRGRGGHAAMPHTAIDPIVCSGQLISALNMIVGRRMNAMDGAVVLSVTGVRTDTMRHNIIPEEVQIMGTFRAFNAYTSEMLEQHIRGVSRSVCESMGCEADVHVKHLTIPLINHPAVVRRLRPVVESIVGDAGVLDDVRTMASEDMSFLLEDIPGLFFFIGTSKTEIHQRYGHHHPRFDIDEEALSIGARIMSRAIAEYLITD